MSNAGLPKFKYERFSADGVVMASPCRVMGVLVAGVHADWAASFHNDVDSAGGTSVLDLSGELEGSQTFFDFTPFGGVLFSVGCYLNLTVTAGFVHVWSDPVSL